MVHSEGRRESNHSLCYFTTNSSILVSNRLECFIRIHGHRMVLLPLSIFSMDVSALLIRLWGKQSPTVFTSPIYQTVSLRTDSETLRLAYRTVS